MANLIIQQITSKWSKRSRGGQDAEVRNQVPESRPLPDFGSSIYGLHHLALFDESSSFQCDEQINELDASGLSALALPIRITLKGDGLSVAFRWSRENCGAPERPSHRLFNLKFGQFGRVVYNGRFNRDWDRSEWTYQKTVLNLVYAVGGQIPNDFFLRSPDTESRLMATLK